MLLLLRLLLLMKYRSVLSSNKIFLNFYFFYVLINTHIFRLMFLNHYLPDEDVVVVVEVVVDVDEQAAVERIAVQLEERNAD
jgi:hypothetical protein